MKHMLWCSIDFQWKLLQIVFDCIYNNQCYIVKVCTISVVVSMIFISYVTGVKMQPTLPSTGSNFTPLWSSGEWRRRNFHETPFPLSSLCSPCKFNELNTHPASAFLKFSVVFISIDRWRASLSPHGPMSVSQQRRTYPSPDPSTVNWYQVRVNPLNPKNDQHLISPNSNDAELVIKIMRIKDMIANPRSFDC